MVSLRADYNTGAGLFASKVNEYKKLTDDYNRAKEALGSREAELKSAQSDIDKANKTASQLEDEKNALLEQLRNAKTDIGRLTQQGASSQEAIGEANQRAADLENELKGAQAKIDANQAKMEDLGKKLGQAKRDAAASQGALQGKQNELDQSHQEIQALRDAYAELDKNKKLMDKRAQEELAAKDEKYAELLKEHERGLALIAERESQLAAKQARERQLQQQNASLQAFVMEMRQQLGMAQRGAVGQAILQTRSQAEDFISRMRAEFEGRMKTLNDELAAARASLQQEKNIGKLGDHKLGIALKEKEKLETELDQLKQVQSVKDNMLREVNNAAAKYLADKQEAEKAANQLGEQKQSLEQKLADAEQRASDTREAMQIVTEVNQQLEEKLDISKNVQKGMLQNLDDLSSRLGQEMVNKHDLDEELARIKKEFAEAAEGSAEAHRLEQKAREVAQKQVDEYIQSLQKQLNESKEQGAKKTQQNQELQSRLESARLGEQELRQKLESAKRNEGELSSQLAELARQNRNLQGLSDEERADFGRKRSAFIEAASTRIQGLKDQLAQAQSKSKQMQRNLRGALKVEADKVVALANKLANAESNRNKLQQDLEAARLGEAGIAQRVEALQAEIAENRATLAERERELEHERKANIFSSKEADDTIDQQEKELAELKQRLNAAKDATERERIRAEMFEAENKRSKIELEAARAQERKLFSDIKTQERTRGVKQSREIKAALEKSNAQYKAMREKNEKAAAQRTVFMNAYRRVMSLQKEKDELSQRLEALQTKQPEQQIQASLEKAETEVKETTSQAGRVQQIQLKELVNAEHTRAKIEKEHEELTQQTLRAVVPAELPVENRVQVAERMGKQDITKVLQQFDMYSQIRDAVVGGTRDLKGKNMKEAINYAFNRVMPKAFMDENFLNSNISREDAIKHFYGEFRNVARDGVLQAAGIPTRGQQSLPRMAAGGAGVQPMGQIERDEMAGAESITVSEGGGGGVGGGGGGAGGDKQGGGLLPTGSGDMNTNAMRGADHSSATPSEEHRERQARIEKRQTEIIEKALGPENMEKVAFFKDIAMAMIKGGVLEANAADKMDISADQNGMDQALEQGEAKSYLYKATKEAVQREIKDGEGLQNYLNNPAIRYIANLVFGATAPDDKNRDDKIFDSIKNGKHGPDLDDDFNAAGIDFADRVKIVRMALAYGTEDFTPKELVSDLNDTPPIPLFEQLLQRQTRSQGSGATQKSRTLHDMMETALAKLEHYGKKQLVEDWRNYLKNLGWKLVKVHDKTKRKERGGKGQVSTKNKKRRIDSNSVNIHPPATGLGTPVIIHNGNG